jgi:hypothetical protein
MELAPVLIVVGAVECRLVIARDYELMLEAWEVLKPERNTL